MTHQREGKSTGEQQIKIGPPTSWKTTSPISPSGLLPALSGQVLISCQVWSGRTRGAVLSVLYGHVGESFYLRQLARLTGKSLGPVQREVRQLVDAGLVTRKIDAARTLYSANRESPVFAEIKSLVTKTIGMRDVLYSALEELRRNINLAFVYGSVARSGETAPSDVDLMVVGKSISALSFPSWPTLRRP